MKGVIWKAGKPEDEGATDSTDESPVGLDCVRPHLGPQVRWKTRKRNAGEPVAFGGLPWDSTTEARRRRGVIIGRPESWKKHLSQLSSPQSAFSEEFEDFLDRLVRLI